jgi:predicted amidohydrolase
MQGEAAMAHAEKIKVAVAQIAPELGDVAANKEKHLEYIARAREQDVDLLVFPELSMTGYSVGPQAVDLAIDRDHPLMHEIASATGPMWTTFGFVEEGVAAQFHNSAITLRDGKIEFIHRKLNLASYGHLEEEKHYAEGRYIETFRLEHTPWRAATMICADLWNPALVHLAAVHGATLLMVPIASAEDVVSGEFSNPNNWRLALEFYAMMYGMPLVVANLAVNEGGLCFWGGSRIIDPFGTTVAQADGGEDLIVGTLDYTAVKRARYQLPTVRDSNLDLLHREIGRLSWQVGIPPESRKI